MTYMNIAEAFSYVDDEYLCLVEQMKKPRRMWRDALKKAAVFFLALLIGVGVWLTVDDGARAAFLNWVVEWYDTQIIYRFSGKPANDPFAPLPRYEVTALPEGYEPYKDEIITPESYDIGYVNADGELFWFGYQRMEQGGVLAIQEETEGMTVYDVTVNGSKGRVYCSPDVEQHSIIVWIDEENNLEFDISGFFDKDELLRFAESVKLEK